MTKTAKAKQKTPTNTKKRHNKTKDLALGASVAKPDEQL